MIGEDKTEGTAFHNINCYSSSNLVEWTYEGALLSRDNSIIELGENWVVERPKVIYNDLNKKYVLWLHIDSANYAEAKVGVATGNSICGQYGMDNGIHSNSLQGKELTVCFSRMGGLVSSLWIPESRYGCVQR